jgi:hypothetical protein
MPEYRDRHRDAAVAASDPALTLNIVTCFLIDRTVLFG